METVILLFSGPIAAGKSTLGKVLVDSHGFNTIRSGRYLQSLAQSQGLEVSRATLQRLGDQLDEQSDFEWLIEDVAVPLIAGDRGHRRWLLDSVRKVRQVELFRSRFGTSVVHIHVVAPESELRRRYEKRLQDGGEYEAGTPYDQAIAHPNEIASRSLGAIANLTVDASEEAALLRVLVAAGI